MLRQSTATPPMTDSHRSSQSAAPSRRRTEPPPKVELALEEHPDATPAHRPPVELGPIVRSKIQPPVLRTSTLSRQRLLDRLHEAVGSRLTLLIAEAGYGKTTLLADFAAHSGLRTMWYRLDSTDADVVTWANHLVAAARELEPTFGQATLGLMSQLQAGGPPKSAFVASVIGELGQLEPTPTVLVLDDFHAVDESADAIEFVARLTRDAPPWLRVVVSTRRRPALELGRLTAAGEVTEMGTDELRFSHDETVDLFATSYGMPLEEDVLRDLDGRTKGWVASLQLFHGSIRGRPPSAVRALARALSGATSPIYDFLAQEVLANLPEQLERFLVRSSLLEPIGAGHVVALFADAPQPPTVDIARDWIEEADRLTLLSRSSQSTDARQLHPLLRDFLVRQLRQRETADDIRQMHLRVARALSDTDPLTAAHHFLEAGEEAEAMHCLGASVMLTMGSGQWGVASDLIERMKDVAADPAVAAIRGRRLIEDGDLDAAAALLAGVDISSSPPDVRAVFRHSRLSLGWRTSDRQMMFATLADIQADSETPSVLRDIFQIFVDASSMSPTPVPYPTLAHRMERMAKTQRGSGHPYYAAISLHNAALTMMAAARFSDAVRLAHEALGAFELLPHFDTEKYSTHAILAACAFELGNAADGEEHIRIALSSGLERGDVHAECAYALAVAGEQSRASQLLLTADELEREGRSDLSATLMSTFTRSMLMAPQAPERVLEILSVIPPEMPLDTGYGLERQMLIALCELLADRPDDSSATARKALIAARSKGARRVVARLELIEAMADVDAAALRSAMYRATETGGMTLAAVADAICRHLWLIPDIPPELRASISQWPRRWLTPLRRQLDSGGTANAVAAAKLLDDFGESSDVPKLRAFAKTYRKVAKGSYGLGRALSRRVAPTLVINDLGRTRLTVGEREVDLGQLRRKSAALLMFLVTRPGFTAAREQAIDELWPESDPDAASNNLNQSLYFLRRDIDPWFEDDISADYVSYQGDLVWLDPQLTSVMSVRFAAEARNGMTNPMEPQAVMRLLSGYTGQFTPEFEYEEWAMAWRSRVHALFLEFANSSIERCISQGAYTDGRDVALLALHQDPGALEIERKLVWLYWHLGSRSASVAQHAHLAALERADGLDPSPIEDLVEESRP